MRQWVAQIFSLLILLSSQGPASVARAERVFFPKSGTTQYSDWFQPASHNSYYHTFKYKINGKDKEEDWWKVLQYTKAVELDVWVGGAQPWAVFHNVSWETQCKGDLTHCLGKIRDWHDENPGHEPITVFIEIKTGLGTGHWSPEKLNGILCGQSRDSRANGREGKAVFACSELFRPGDLLGEASYGSDGSLRKAASGGFWPTLAKLKGKLIFVLNSESPAITVGYLRRSQNTVTPSDGREQANAFVMYGVKEESDITGIPHQIRGVEKDAEKQKTLAENIVFYNNECGNWKDDWGSLIRQKNYLSRGYYCGTDASISGSAKTEENYQQKWISTHKLNFVAYDDIAYAYGLKGNNAWNDGSPQGDYSAWELNPGTVPNTSWDQRVRTVGNLSPGEARRRAEEDSAVSYFFYSKSGYHRSGYGAIQPDTALYFSGRPPPVSMPTGPSPGDTYVRRGRGKDRPSMTPPVRADLSQEVPRAPADPSQAPGPAVSAPAPSAPPAAMPPSGPPSAPAPVMPASGPPSAPPAAMPPSMPPSMPSSMHPPMH